MYRTSVMRAATVTAAGFVALTAFAGFQDVTLKRRPKVGDVAEYKVSARFKADQGEIVFGQKRVEKVTEVKPAGGFMVELSTSETKVSFGDQDMPERPETMGTEEIGADGLVRSVTADPPIDAANYRISNLHGFKAPDSSAMIGDEINFEIPLDTKKGTPAVKATFKGVSRERVKDWDTVKLAFTLGNWNFPERDGFIDEYWRQGVWFGRNESWQS